jgi:hypothetical protein
MRDQVEHLTATETEGPRIFWGGLEVPECESTGHFLCVGSPSSGKSITIRLLLQSVAPHIERRSNRSPCAYRGLGTLAF